MISEVINSFGVESNKAVFYLNAIAINLVLPVLKGFAKSKTISNQEMTSIISKFFKSEMDRVGYKDSDNIPVDVLDGDYSEVICYPNGSLFCMFENSIIKNYNSPTDRVREMLEFKDEPEMCGCSVFLDMDDITSKFINEFGLDIESDSDRNFINANMAGMIGSLVSATGDTRLSYHPLYKCIMYNKIIDEVISADNFGKLLNDAKRFAFGGEISELVKEYIRVNNSSLIKELLDAVNNIVVIGDCMIEKGASIAQLFDYRVSK